MRLHVDLSSHLVGNPQIIQVDTTPNMGVDGQVAVNGKYLIPTPLEIDFEVNADSYILDGAGEIDGGDVTSQGFARLLAKYPQFGHIYFNPLLTADHLDELDSTFDFRDPGTTYVFNPRYQVGREASLLTDIGQMPTSTAVLPVNATVSPNRPGLLVTDAVDIGPYTLDCDGNQVGTDVFMVYWKIYDFNVTHDIAADYGAQVGGNSPALRHLLETDQEPTDFAVYLSNDDGINWCEVGLLEPLAFCDKSKTVRLAFRNNSLSKVYLAHFALLF